MRVSLREARENNQGVRHPCRRWGRGHPGRESCDDEEEEEEEGLFKADTVNEEEEE